MVVLLWLASLTSGQYLNLSCGKPKVNIAPFIHKGSNAVAGHWPWHAALFLKEEYQCGGSIIDANTILTVSHCVYTSSVLIPTTQVTVHVGRVHLSETNEHTQIHNVQEIILHPEIRNNSINHDIALIKLSSNITMNRYVQPVCLWTMDSKQETIVDKNGTVVGFGLNEQDVVTGQLKQAVLQVVDPFSCIQQNRKVFGPLLTPDVFCAIGKTGVSACNGDSGGGMFFEVRGKWFVRGLVSYTPVRGNRTWSLCDPLKPTVFTDVAKYLDWIKPHIDQRVLALESDLFDIDYEEKFQLFNFQTCGLKSSLTSREGEVWTLPWIGVFGEKGNFIYNCEITLISEWYAVGPASCFANVGEHSLISLGAYDGVDNVGCNVHDGIKECYYPTQIRQIKNVIIHPEFDQYKQTHNIALIELLTPADITQPNVKPICLPITSELRTNATTNLHVTIPDRKNFFSNIPVQYVDSVECVARLSQRKVMLNIENNQLCAEKTFNNDKRACIFRIPGLPLQEKKMFNGTERYLLRGLDVSGLTCSAVKPIVYLNVEPYLDWILYNMRYNTVEAPNASKNATDNQTLESAWGLLQVQPGKEKLRLFNMDICGVTSTSIGRKDHVPWIGALIDDRKGYATVLISEWYALAPKRVVLKNKYWRYLLLGEYYWSTTDEVMDEDGQKVEIKTIIIPPPDHPRQNFALIELLEPADLKNPNIKPICLPFMKQFHELNTTELVLSLLHRYSTYSINVTILDHLICQQKLLLNGYAFAEGNSTCATRTDGLPKPFTFNLLGTLFQMRAEFADHEHYFLYGINLVEFENPANVSHLSDLTALNYDVYLLHKIELEDLDWILENMQEKLRQGAFPFSNKRERVNFKPVKVLSSKRGLLNFATCGVSSSSNATPWIGTLLCRESSEDYPQLKDVRMQYKVTLISEWYAVGPVPLDDLCLKNDEGSSNVAIFGYPCYESTERDMDETDIIESCPFPSQRIAIQKVFVHPQFDKNNYANNIALIRLATTVNTSFPNVKPICLPIFDVLRSYDTSSLTMVSTDSSEQEYNNTNVDDRYVDQTECQHRWKNRNVNIVIDSSNHCVMNKRTSDEECINISHGASLQSRQRFGSSERNFLRGFAFDEASHCSFYFPAIYTNTDTYIEWILETMEPLASQPFDLRKELIFSN